MINSALTIDSYPNDDYQIPRVAESPYVPPMLGQLNYFKIVLILHSNKKI